MTAQENERRVYDVCYSEGAERKLAEGYEKRVTFEVGADFDTCQEFMRYIVAAAAEWRERNMPEEDSK